MWTDTIQVVIMVFGAMTLMVISQYIICLLQGEISVLFLTLRLLQSRWLLGSGYKIFSGYTIRKLYIY